MTAAGQLNGSTAATTPWGTRSTIEVPAGSGAMAAAIKGASAEVMARAADRSNNDSTAVLPCSRVRRADSVSKSMATDAWSQARSTTAARSARVRPAHAGCERRAADTAASNWAGDALGARSTTSTGRAGFTTG